VLQESIEKIRKEFFPRWDKSQEWKALLGSDCPDLGKCGPKGKRVLVQYVPKKKVELEWNCKRCRDVYESAQKESRI
jgi:hypothetical protein